MNGYQIAIPRSHEAGSGHGPANEWKITLGLLPGYRAAASGEIAQWGVYAVLTLLGKVPILGEMLEHLVEVLRHYLIRRAFAEWRMQRALAGEMWVTGFIEYKEVLYTHKTKQGYRHAREPVAVLEGIQSPLLNSDFDAWKAAVIDLATTLGRRLRQTRVYVQVGPEIIVFELPPEARV
ncbi:MAG: hypothetical protein KDD69_12260 [Bdellovibrionales bacterium]|nr:hypothetical protein [Bdellovibrionales bacterium]